jgi:hypothetical protein
LVVLLLAAGAALAPAEATAAPVLLFQPDGHPSLRQDPFLPTVSVDPAMPRARTWRVAAARAPRARAASERTVRGELLRLYHAQQITLAAYRSYRASFETALGTVPRLGGTRAYELQAIVTNLHEIAAAGALTASRLPALFLTLDRNRQWWTTDSLLSSGDRVEFPGSELVWEYYPGQGLELQELGSFGKADGFYTGGRSLYPRLRHLLAELIPLAARRAGGLTWEYYFSFDGGSPPWTSAMSQGTALEALTRAYRAFHDKSYLDVARRALSIFHVAPPAGVTVHTSRGSRYLLYSFAPGAPVLNGFLWSLVGLYDYAQAAHSGEARRLFSAGDAEARAELPGYDTGGWSLYQPGQLDTLDYHQLVTGFVQNLCSRTRARPYCLTAQHFDSELKTPPTLNMLTHRTRRGLDTTIRFWLSKPAHVGIVVVRNGQTVFLTSADFTFGVNAFDIGAPGHTGPYTLRLAATDLAGNSSRIVGTLQVS